MAERPSLGRDDSYNRVRVPTDLRSQIYNMIADSSESIPLDTVQEDESAPGSQENLAAAPHSASNANSRLKESVASSDFATPTPEKQNPLEQAPTVREEFPIADPHVAPVESPTDLNVQSPVRSHEIAATHSESLAPRVAKMMIKDTAADLFGGDKEQENTTASRQTTLSAAPSDTGSKKERPGMASRTSTMKRISSMFKRTESKNQ